MDQNRLLERHIGLLHFLIVNYRTFSYLRCFAMSEVIDRTHAAQGDFECHARTPISEF